ncbi:MAG: T9SS type A sorting domain-containing protein [Candidatus Delongbacteria bacterium]|nr:T9SS type A sorting domain-containing protein [Candidatus Delongbacteria bacterium]
MINNFLKYLRIVVILTSVSLFSKTTIDLSKLNSSVSGQKASNLNVLAIMVEFEEDTLDYTTGNGTFNSGYEYPDSLLLDAVDHNAEYFTDQLTYVKNYFQAVSNGNVQFDNITVLDTIITLTHPIWYYNQNHTDEILEEKLYELYQSSWAKIASDNSVDFSSYDTFVIFHAGSGQEFSAGYDDTPFDIPSVFFSENDLSSTSVTAWDGTEINNCIILPESEWQISNDKWLYAGMGGISTLMFAHRLGIPNLYSSEDGKSCIGRFGLMDQGSGNFSGMMPSSVCAWVKEQQGWVDIQDITSTQNDIIVKADSTIYRIPINNDEYFLIENRTPTNYTLANSEIYGYDRDGLRIKFYYGEYGVERYEIVDAGFKTLVSIQDNDYDFALTYGFETEDPYDPQTLRTGGILIWHIDKRKTTLGNIVNNTVNDDHDNRGVYLEEGDGSFDIGKDYWLFDAGYGTELGWYYDFFFRGNEVWTGYSNQDIGDIEFSGASYPRSDSNEGIDTGIRLFDFSGISRNMTFSFEMENQLTGYPLNSGLENSRYFPFYFNDELHHLFYRNDGEIRIQLGDSLMFTDNAGVMLSDEYEPVDYKGNLVLVHADSLGLTTIDMNALVIINTPVSKVTAQIKPGVIPTEEGLHIWTDVLVWDVDWVTFNILSATDIAVVYDDSKNPYFIAAIKDSLFYVYEGFGSFIPYNNDKITDSSRIYIIGQSYDGIDDVIIVDDTNVMISSWYWLVRRVYTEVIKYLDINNLTSLNDLDEDGNIDYLVTDQGMIEVYNEHGYMENGFPLETRMDQIDNIFTYETIDGKYCTFVDSTMNCGSYSFDGDYVRTENFTLGSDINDIGLLESNGQVCIYSYDKLGTLNAYLLSNGELDSYLMQQNGFIQLAQIITPNSSNITDKKSVYNWPNPAKGNSTNFRFFLNEPSTVNITIYDLNGNRVKELSETFSGSGDNFEIEWDVSSKPSGIYTAVLEFVSGSKNEKYKVKVAIIK